MKIKVNVEVVKELDATDVAQYLLARGIINKEDKEAA